jgi:hypothetical protein
VTAGQGNKTTDKGYSDAVEYHQLNVIPGVNSAAAAIAHRNARGQ